MKNPQSCRHWQTPHTIKHETDAIRLLQFSSCTGTPLIIVPPQAGHHSYIADYGSGQSLVECAVGYYTGPVYAIEWKSCTHRRRNEGIVDLLLQLNSAITAAGGKATLVGLCQGGWLATIYAALHPDQVASLVIAGAPIDTHAGKSVIHKAVEAPMWMYECAVMAGFGRMRGQTMLASWKSSDPIKHYVTRYTNPGAYAERFYKWYDHTQDLAGAWYLWAVKYLFKKNHLFLNKLKIGKTRVDLNDLQQLDALHIVTGTKDDITPAMQSHALLLYAHAETHSVDAGHIGVFMSRTGIKEVWSPLFSRLHAPKRSPKRRNS
jgi:poly(3-hydroxyalkanoate) synthetase